MNTESQILLDPWEEAAQTQVPSKPDFKTQLDPWEEAAQNRDLAYTQNALKKADNLRPLFQGADKITEAFDPLERVKVNKLMDFYGNQDEMKMKLANTMFLANRTGTDPMLVLKTYDSFSKTYFKKELSVADAYKQISNTVNTKNPFQFNGGKLNAIQQELKNYLGKNVSGNLDNSIVPFQKKGSAVGVNVGKSVKADFLNVVGSMEQIPLLAHDLLNDAGAVYYNTCLDMMDGFFGRQTTERFLYSNELPFRSSGAWLEKKSQEKLKAAEELRGQYTNGKSIMESFKESPAKGMEQLLYGVTGNMLTLGVQTAITVANPIAGATFMGGISSGGKYAEIKTDNAMSPLGIYTNVLVTGGSEIIFEYTFSTPLIKGFTSEVKKELKRGAFNAGVQILKGTGQEGIEEGLTQVSQNFIDLLTHKGGADYKKMSGEQIFDYLSNGVPDAALVGGVMGGGMAAMGRYRQLSYAQRDKVDAEIVSAAEQTLAGLDAKPSLNGEETRLKKVLSENIDNPEKLLKETGKIYAENQSDEEVKYILNSLEVTGDEEIKLKETESLESTGPNDDLMLYNSGKNQQSPKNIITENRNNSSDEVTLAGSGGNATPRFNAPDGIHNGLDILYNGENKKANPEDYKKYIETQVSSGKMNTISDVNINHLVEKFSKFPLNQSIETKQGEKISFFPDKTTNVNQYIHHFLTKRDFQTGLENYSPEHLENYDGMIDTIKNYDHRILGEDKGKERVYYVKQVAETGKKSRHLFIASVDGEGRLVAWNQFATRPNYINSLRNAEEKIIESRGLQDANGKPVEMAYDEYAKAKDSGLYYLKNKDAGKKPAFHEKLVSSLDGAEKNARDRIKKFNEKLSGGRLMDITQLTGESVGYIVDLSIIGASKMAKGTVSISLWTKEMLGEFGDAIKPHINDIYQKSIEIYERSLSEIDNVQKSSKGYLENFKKLFDDPSYVRDADSLQWDSRVTRILKLGDKASLQEALELVNSKFQGAAPDLKAELDGIQHRMGNRLNELSGIEKKAPKKQAKKKAPETSKFKQPKSSPKSEPASKGDHVEHITRGVINDVRRKAYMEGRKAGYTEAEKKYKKLMEDIKNKPDDLPNQQKTLIDYAVKNLKPGSRDFILAKIKTLNNRDSAENRKKRLKEIMAEIDAEKEKTAADDLRGQIRKILKGSVVKRDQKGRPTGKYGADVQEDIDIIRKIAEMPSYQVDKEIENLTQHMDVSADGERHLEMVERLGYLGTFGDLNNKNPEELRNALKEIKALIKNGRTLIKDELKARHEKYERMRKTFTDEVTGGAGLMSHEAEILMKHKRDSSPVKGMAHKFYIKGLNFEWLMNNVMRLAPSSLYTTQGGEFVRSVNRATQKYNSGMRATKNNIQDAMKQIFNTKSRHEINLKNAELKKLEKNTGVVIYDIEHDSKDVKKLKYKTVPYSTAKRRLQDHDNHLHPMPSWESEAIRQQVADIEAKDLNAAWTKTDYREYYFDDGLTDDYIKQLRKENNMDDSEPLVLLAEKPFGKTKEIPLTQMTGLSYWLWWQQPDIRYKLEYAGWNQESFDQLGKFLKPETKKLGEWMRNELKLEHKSIDAVFSKLYHVHVPSLQNYFPSRFRQFSKGRSDAPMLDTQLGMSSINPGSFISRKFHLLDPMDSDAEMLFISHKTQMEHFKAFAKPILEMRGVLQSRQVRLAITQRRGDDTYAELMEKINMLADGGNRTARKIQALDVARSNYAGGKLFGNVVSGIKQVFGSITYLNDIPAKAYIMNSAAFFKNPVENIEKLKDTEYFKNRWDTGTTREMMHLLDWTHTMAEGNASRTRELMETGTAVTKLGDALASIVAGYSVYKYYYDGFIKRGLSEADAHEKAVEEWGMSTDRTQQAGHVKDLNSFQLGGSVERMLTTWLSNPVLMFQMEAERVADALHRKDADSIAIAAKTIFVNHVIVPAAMTFVDQLVRHGFDDWEWEDFLAGFLLGPLESVFLVGKAAKTAIESIIGGAYRIADLSLITGDAVRLVNLLKNYDKIELTPEYILKALSAIGSGLAPVRHEAAILGGATTQIKRVLKALGVIDDKKKEYRPQLRRRNYDEE